MAGPSSFAVVRSTRVPWDIQARPEISLYQIRSNVRCAKVPGTFKPGGLHCIRTARSFSASVIGVRFAIVAF
jgi:hypothetical protein